MKIHPQVMHRLECIDCGQVGGLKKSAGTPRQPSDFKANCTVSMASAVDKCWASGCPHTYRRFGPRRPPALTCSSDAHGSCLMKRPAGPLDCRVIFGPTRTEPVTDTWSRNRKMPTTRQAGAAGRNRTCDPLLRREMLYPLSYSREAGQCIKGAGRGQSRIRKVRRLLEGYENAHVSGM